MTELRDPETSTSPSVTDGQGSAETPREPGSTGELPLPLHPEELEARDEWLSRLALARWSALRPSKIQIAALVLLSVFALGPIVAMVLILGADADPSSTLLSPESPAPADGVHVVGTITRVDAVAGEMAVRLLVVPQAELTGDDGRLTQSYVLRVNDARGGTTVTFPAGQVPTPIEISLALTGGSVSRYPFDSYDARLVVAVQPEVPTDAEGVSADAASDGPEPDASEEVTDVAGDRLPIAVDLLTTVTEFELAAQPAADADPAANFALVELTATRSQTTTVYAMGIMALMWGLAVTGVLMAWAVVIWRVETPMWVYGYLVGVLFALPPLREALPGRPPPGTLVDYAAFYWSIGIIGVTLLLMMSLWIRRSRPEDRPRLFSHHPPATTVPQKAEEPTNPPT